MKLTRYLLLMLSIFIFNITLANASSCKGSIAKDLSQITSHVKVDYELIDKSQRKELVIGEDKKEYIIPNFVFNISLYNITDDIYVEITNDVTSENRKVYYKDTNDGVYTFSNDDFGRIYNYTFMLKSNNSDCMGDNIRKLTYTKPMYNAFSEYTYCQTSSSFYCQRFVTKPTDLIGEEDFLKKISANNSKNKPEEGEEQKEETFIDKIKSNKNFYIILILVVVALTIGTIIIINKRKKRWEL